MANAFRCAIYTRKSSEEGLDQDFNSLHAQREACEAYVRSQVGEGWMALAAVYDDGGFSGGSLERPGLKRLLADITAGRVDIVVVYKVDRLTRSLADFAKIVDIFDARNVSFVSVTQSFNTTTSMGRLTLNMLLSFAQFEREVTGERIRDKIAASKAKGMWMGGMLPLGYDPSGRTLVINEAEAEVVRHIFQRYLEVLSVKALAVELEAQGIRSKVWTTTSGKVMGGGPLGRGALLHILKSQLYRGEIVHKGVAHPGQHPPLISSEAHSATQAKLAASATRKHDRPGRAIAGPLKGLLFDASGSPMSPSFGYGRGGRLYRYYVSPEPSIAALPPVDGFIRRVAAPAVEQFLLHELGRLSARPPLALGDIKALLRRVEIRTGSIHLVMHPSAFEEGHADLALAALQDRLQDGEHAVSESDGAFRVVLARRLQLRGGRTTISGGTEASRREISPRIISALRRGHTDLLTLAASPFSSGEQLRRASAPTTQHGHRLGCLAFLSPALQRAILTGAQARDLTLSRLLAADMPLAWADQARWLETYDAR